jgi:enoyl-CoA hydratase/carnithine racemase
MEHVLTQHTDEVFEIILNRPDKRNALRVQMLLAIAEAVTLAENTSGVRVILLRGEGQSFCAGLDLMSMGGIPEYLGDEWQTQGYRATRLWQTSIHRLQESTLPTIALLHGHTLGGGLELALGCDLRIAAEDTRLSLEEARLGMIPDAGGTTRLTRLIGAARTKELIFTGRRIDAATAERWGLVNQVVPTDQLQEAGLTLAHEIAACAPLALSAAKRTINAVEDVLSGFHHEMVEQYQLFHSQDIMEGLQAAMERRPARWQGK